MRRALAPLLTIERLVREREPGDLTPISAPAPAEVRQLLGGLNRFMERLQATLGLMQGFLADAAHQIRTPLATLRAQADLAVEEADPVALRSYVHKIHRNARLASQVTNQLLSHTMVSHRGQVAVRRPVDLVTLPRQVAQRAEWRSAPSGEASARRWSSTCAGWTQVHVSPETMLVPTWANWREEAYGFTLEPAVIVYARQAFGPGEAPRSRPELLRLLQAQPDRFRRRVATYDIAEAGVG